jgi:hypothetical protein
MAAPKVVIRIAKRTATMPMTTRSSVSESPRRGVRDTQMRRSLHTPSQTDRPREVFTEGFWRVKKADGTGAEIV